MFAASEAILQAERSLWQQRRITQAICHNKGGYQASNDGASALLGEPLLGLLLRHFLEATESTTAVLLLGDASAGSAEDDVEVHTEDTGRGVVLDAQVNVLLNAEAEVACRLLDEWTRYFYY